MNGKPQEPGAGLAALRSALGEIVSTTEEDLRRVSFDAMKLAFPPEAVAMPTSEEQVGELLVLANEFQVPVTTRGAGSSLTGSATPLKSGWVLDLSRMNAFSIDRDERVCVAQAGAVVADLQAEAEEVGLFYPPDPSSKDIGHR